MSNRHIFALHVTGTLLPVHLFGKISLPYQHLVHDASVAHRLVNVLRCPSESSISFFDDQLAVEAIFHKVQNKDTISITITKITPLQPLEPHVTILLPLLKREALAEALYSCTELGATAIIPIITDKTHGEAKKQATTQRLTAIMVAAAEQSKQFVLPSLTPAQPLSAVLTAQLPAARLYLDPTGMPLWQTIDRLRTEQATSIVMGLGPEGDFTTTEKSLLISAGFQPCALTKTVLRAPQALTVALGAIRSMLPG